MSLTSSLNDPSSAMSRFLSEHLPNAHDLLRDCRKRLTHYPAPVKPEIGPDQRQEYRTLGRTIDHRLRISLGAPTGQPIKDGSYGQLSRMTAGRVPKSSTRCRPQAW
ncbi:hypothetical protein [Streptomyces luteogriseus]|uniref:hypothetical protein n=1 Tax=Streptomyces luteogriseus TaxID=68233 RepID=UPI003715EAD4